MRNNRRSEVQKWQWAKQIKSESENHSVRFDSLQPLELYSPWNVPGQNTGVGSLSLLQGIFPTQESNPGLLHCRQVLYQLSHQGRMNGSWQMKDKKKDLRQKEPHQ